MSYWRTFYHVVWATQYREPLLTPERESLIYPAMINQAHELDVVVYALNGTVDHVHMAAAIPPRYAVATVVGKIKGRVSFIMHNRLHLDFAWQKGYGVHTFAEKHLPGVVDYIRCQKEHHARQTLNLRLERVGEDDDGPHAVIPDESYHE